MIIGISGKIASGKDTFAQMLIEHSKVPFETRRFAFKLKYIASYLTGVPLETFESQEGKQMFLEEWNMTAREFLIKLGTDAVRNNLDSNTWVKALFADYKQGMNWIIPDVRFPNEKQEISRRGGILIRINRPGLVGVSHQSETALDFDEEWDFIIENDKTLDFLNQQAKILMGVLNTEI